MRTRAGLRQEKNRKLSWLVYWWEVPDHDTGKQKKRSKSFEDKRDAVSFQAKKQVEIDEGGSDDSEPPEDVTLGKLLKDFTEIRLKDLSYSSKKCYGNTMKQMRGHFGDDRLVKSIRLQDAEKFMVTRTRVDGRNGELSSWSKSQHRTQCSAIFNAAIEWGHTDKNPFAAPKGRSSTPLRVKGKSGPWQHITPPEFVRFLEAVPTARERATFWLMYGCGLRPGEVYNLTIDNVDLERRCVHVVNRAATDDAPPFKIKAHERSDGSKERSVSIPEDALADLTEAAQGAFKAGGFVALSPDRFQRIQHNWRLCRAGEPWCKDGSFRPWRNTDMVNNLLRDAKRYMRKAGVELTAPLKLTTFRKSFAQNHADNGTPLKMLAELLGHSGIQVTTEFYNRVTDANKQAAAATMDRIFAKLHEQGGARDAG